MCVACPAGCCAEEPGGGPGIGAAESSVQDRHHPTAAGPQLPPRGTQPEDLPQLSVRALQAASPRTATTPTF